MSDELILVQNLIHEIRGQKVMLDFDLARLYQVKTGELNQSVKRNIKRFPPDFMFQLTPEEVKMMSQIVISSRRKASAPPFAFTEQGVAMLSGLLRSDVAIAANIAIMRAWNSAFCAEDWLKPACMLVPGIETAAEKRPCVRSR